MRTTSKKEAVREIRMPDGASDGGGCGCARAFDPLLADLLVLVAHMLMPEQDLLTEAHGETSVYEQIAFDVIENANRSLSFTARGQTDALALLAHLNFRKSQRREAISLLRRGVGSIANGRMEATEIERQMRQDNSLNVWSAASHVSLEAKSHIHYSKRKIQPPVCTMSLADRKTCAEGNSSDASILITRSTQSGQCIAIRSWSTGVSGHSVLWDLQELKNIKKESTAQQRQAISESVSRRDWWQKRMDLDERLEAAVESAASWLGPWRSMLLGEPQGWWLDLADYLGDMCCQKLAISSRESDGVTRSENAELCTLLASGAMLGALSKAELVVGLQSLISREAQGSELDDCATSLFSELPANEHDQSLPRTSLVLVLDDALSSFPWESVAGANLLFHTASFPWARAPFSK